MKDCRLEIIWVTSGGAQSAAVARHTDKWRAERRRVQAFLFRHFSLVACAKSNFLARINPYLAELKLSYPSLAQFRQFAQ